jgi:hypothetical protein
MKDLDDFALEIYGVRYHKLTTMEKHRIDIIFQNYKNKVDYERRHYGINRLNNN